MLKKFFSFIIACFLAFPVKSKEKTPTMKMLISETLLNDVLKQYLPTNFDHDLQIRNMSLGPLKFLWMANSIPLENVTISNWSYGCNNTAFELKNDSISIGICKLFSLLTFIFVAKIYIHLRAEYATGAITVDTKVSVQVDMEPGQLHIDSEFIKLSLMDIWFDWLDVKLTGHWRADLGTKIFASFPWIL